MANINNMEMAKAVLANENIVVEKTFFGLRTKFTYKPTNSTVEGREYEFTPSMGERMLKLINTDDSKLETVVANTDKITTTHIGHYRLEICTSADNKFTALQMLRFVDFKYQPESDVKFYEGKNAELILSVL